MTPAAEHSRWEAAKRALGLGDQGHPAFTDAEERLIAAEQARRDDWVGDDRRRQQQVEDHLTREPTP